MAGASEQMLDGLSSSGRIDSYIAKQGGDSAARRNRA